jgi:hypothetical protein
MAYIGREPQIGNFQVCDAISVVNGQAAYTMQVNSVNVSPETANHMLVSLNGVLQAPGSSYTVSGSTITFASNLVTGDVINFIHILGSVLDLGVPSDSTVSLAKLTATGTKDATTFLRGDNTFAAPSGGGKVLQVQNMTTTTNTDTTSTSFVATGLTDTITPSATDSKILIMATGNLLSTGTNIFVEATIAKGGTNLGASDGMVGVQTPAGDVHSPFSIIYLDSPSSTSSLTYDVRIKSENSGTTVKFNNGNRKASLTLIEIGA